MKFVEQKMKNESLDEPRKVYKFWIVWSPDHPSPNTFFSANFSALLIDSSKLHDNLVSKSILGYSIILHAYFTLKRQ